MLVTKTHSLSTHGNIAGSPAVTLTALLAIVGGGAVITLKIDPITPSFLKGLHAPCSLGESELDLPLDLVAHALMQLATIVQPRFQAVAHGLRSMHAPLARHTFDLLLTSESAPCC